MWRREAPHVLGALVRRYGDFDRAEDAVQEALLAAATQWPVEGVPDSPLAAAFLVPEATMAQRISRAKVTLRAAEARFPPVRADEPPDRLVGVRHALYLIFNEGYAASAGPVLVDVSFTREAIRVARELHRVSDDPESAGLLALMLLTDARRPARTDADGTLVPLARQDRSRWDAGNVAEGVELLSAALPRGPVGPYQLQAAIAAIHDEAPTWAATDWVQITILYRMLERVTPAPVVTLNAAVAVGMAAPRPASRTCSLCSTSRPCAATTGCPPSAATCWSGRGGGPRPPRPTRSPPR